MIVKKIFALCFSHAALAAGDFEIGSWDLKGKL